MTAHSTLGASSSYRWLSCPGSIKLSEGIPNESSIHAQTGTVAHWVGSECLETGEDAAVYVGETCPDYPDVEITEEMCDAVQVYLDAVRNIVAEYERAGFTDAELGVEVRFDLEHIYAGMFGTCDAVVYLPAWKRLYVFDYKHGWVSVEAERNPQTMYYALGALTGKHNRPIEKLDLVIVQPRSTRQPVKSWECDVVDLMDFRADLVAGAKKTEDPKAALSAGDWCKFCPAAPICPQLEKKAYEVAMAEFNIDDTVKLKEVSMISPDKLKIAWENASILEDWIASVKSYAHAQALAGKCLPGTKLVRGRKGAKKWKDEEEATKCLTALAAKGAIKDGIHNTKLKTPTQVEACMAKNDKSLIAALWVQREGGLSLVDASDSRPSAIVDANTEF